MKNFNQQIIITLLLLFFTGCWSNSNSQSCTPNHPDITQVPDTGIMLPSNLPHAKVGTYYEQCITFGVPSTAEGYDVNWLKFTNIENDITNNSWGVVNNSGGNIFEEWTKLTWHCVTIKGTPTEAGIDSIHVFVDANVKLGFINTTQNTEAFTIPLIVDIASDIVNNPISTSSKLIESYPNPFQTYTQIGIISEKNDIAYLNIYSIFGQLLYSEIKSITKGESFFNFDGSKLNNGTYLYTVSTSQNIFNSTLIKL